MKVAVTYQNGEIFQHFGHTKQFKIYDIDEQKIINSEVISTDGNEHEALTGFLKTAGVDTLICGGIGSGAQNALKKAGIQFFGGCSGTADNAIDSLLNSCLIFNPNVSCNHHEHDQMHNCNGSCH